MMIYQDPKKKAMAEGVSRAGAQLGAGIEDTMNMYSRQKEEEALAAGYQAAAEEDKNKGIGTQTGDELDQSAGGAAQEQSDPEAKLKSFYGQIAAYPYIDSPERFSKTLVDNGYTPEQAQQATEQYWQMYLLDTQEQREFEDSLKGNKKPVAAPEGAAGIDAVQGGETRPNKPSVEAPAGGFKEFKDAYGVGSDNLYDRLKSVTGNIKYTDRDYASMQKRLEDMGYSTHAAKVAVGSIAKGDLESRQKVQDAINVGNILTKKDILALDRADRQNLRTYLTELHALNRERLTDRRLDLQLQSMGLTQERINIMAQQLALAMRRQDWKEKSDSSKIQSKKYSSIIKEAREKAESGVPITDVNNFLKASNVPESAYTFTTMNVPGEKGKSTIINVPVAVDSEITEPSTTPQVDEKTKQELIKKYKY
jgi:hypothetical protein